MRKYVVLIMWYFVAITLNEGLELQFTDTIGPFLTQARCEVRQEHRKLFRRRYEVVFPCVQMSD